MICVCHARPLFGRSWWCSSTGDVSCAGVFLFIYFFHYYFASIYIFRLYIFSLGSEISVESSFRRAEIACTASRHCLMLLLLCIIVILFYLSYRYLFPSFIMTVSSSTTTQAKQLRKHTRIITV